MNPTPRRCSRPSLGQGALVIIVAFLAIAFSIPDGAPTARAQDDDCGKWKWAVYHDCPGPHGCCELQFGILSRSELEKEGRTIIGAYDTEQEARQATCGQLSNVVHVSAPAGTCNGVKGDVSGDRYGLSEIVIYNYNTGDWTCPEARPDDDQDGVPNDMDSCENTSPGTLVSRSGCPCEEPPEPEPQPEPEEEEEEEEEKPSNARISVDPEEGPPGSEVEVRGEGFPDDAEVEIRWDAPDGELLTTVWSGGEGEFSTRFMVPEDAEEGERRVYAVYTNSPPVWVWTPFRVRIFCVSGYVRARLRGGLPLEGVRVALTWLGPNGPQIIPHAPPGGGAPRAFVTTNAQGEYAICNAQIVIPMQNLLLAVSLNESNWGTFQVGDETTNNIVRAYFGQGGQIGANPATVNTWFSITGTADLSKDLWFEDLADDEATADVREDHALDAALVYYHTHQAMRVYRRIGAPVVPAPGGQPLQVITFSNNPTAWPGGATIFINEDDSAWNNGEAPKNREWHEFSHYMMWRVYGRMPPLHAEADDINGNGFLDADVNHGGYWYNMMSSSDAIVEGFAVFMAMVIADQMEQDGEIYMNDHVPPYIYPIGTGAYQPAMCNLEINYPQNRLLSLPADYRRGFYDQLSGAQRANAAEKPRPWRAIADEDLSVASTLWDVYDGQSSGDQDEISVDLQALWPVWAGAYQVPQYFAAPTVGGFLGDAFTYGSTANPSRWRDNSFVGERRRNAPFPIVVRNIWYIIDLYTALTTSLPGQRSQIDQVFRSHKIYLNTFREFADSTTLQMDDLVSFGDPGSTVSLSVSPEAAHEFWSEGIVADLDVAGWGAGFTVNQEPYVDARGYLYIWIWVNAPEGTAFDIVVEDDEGQWLCSGTSEALYGMDDPPEEWRYFQRGTGRWSAYSPPGVVGEDYPFVAVLRPSPAEEDWRHVYDFRPNPNHKTPPGEVSGPDLSRIHGIGVLFTDPGSYQAMVGSIVLTADYPWKPGMTSIVGIGDPALALFRPYRRNTPPVPGSKARIQLNEAPATLLVSLDYAPPYEDLSFTYQLTVDNTTEEIYLFVEPPLEGGENTITIAAESEDYETEETFTMTSTEFWSTLEEGSYVANVSLELVRKRWDPGSLIGTAAGAGVLGLCCCLPVLGAGAVGGYMLLRRREKRSAPPAPPAPPAPTTVAWGRLSISEGPSASRTVWLDKPVLIIGRSSSADLVLQDPLVSGRHAQLRWQDGVAILDDLRSTNGTLVNGQRVTSSHAIRPGDVIQMGHTKLLFQRADHRPS